jgi:hypothetical protein
MRSSILISLALILSLQLVSSQDLVGIWSNPMTTYDSDSYCCVPTSITIEAMEGTSNMRATYQFPSIFQQGYNAKCGFFFNGAVGSGSSTTLYKDASTGQYFIQKYDMSYFSNRNYIFAVSGSSLTVKGAGASSATTCSFAMNTKSSGSGGSAVGLIIFILVIVGIIAYKNHQKKQQSAIIAQNLAQNDTTIYQPQPQPTYVAPQQYMYAQPGYVAQPGFVAQPQMGFVAQQPQAQVGFVAQPGQPQMTMNVNMNANPNGHMNGAVAVNVGAGVDQPAAQ